MKLHLLIFFIVTFISSGASAGRIQLDYRLSNELNRILRVSESLQKAMIRNRADAVELSVREIVGQVERATSLSVLAKPHERNHLLRILSSAQRKFQMAQIASGQQRHDYIAAGLHQLVNLVRIYQVDRSYTIFFCPHDKNSWVQKGLKAQNPFRTPASSVDCGIRVID